MKIIEDSELNQLMHDAMLHSLLDELGAPKEQSGGKLSAFGRLWRIAPPLKASSDLLALARDFLSLMECHELRKHVDVTRHGAFDYYAKNARAAITKAEARA